MKAQNYGNKIDTASALSSVLLATTWRENKYIS